MGKDKILIVDDDSTNIKILIEAFKSEYEIRFATNGPDALEIAASKYLPDLILLDIMMPGMDGYEVCKKLKENKNTQNIPVVFITARDEDSDETKGFEIGAEDYIKKPFSQVIVMARVKTHLMLKKARETLENYNNLLREKVKERTRELEETQVEIVERLSSAAESRDGETGNHIKRMSEFCRLLGQLAEYSPEESDILALSSTLHDIGKIGIPDTILLKPGELTEDEWVIMRSHPIIGAGLLSGSKSKLLQLGESIALTHHEKWDGSGYPRGLSGEEIPIPGRIAGICDVFDALISRRPYKERWSVKKALKEIEALSGIHFDPNLVKLFLELEPKLRKIVGGLE